MGDKVFFASDFHLGDSNEEENRIRERTIVRWLDSIKSEAKEIYLMGDLFDFWFEYRSAIPKGFVRIQGKLAELRDAGIPIYFFTGNHDMWMFDYFERELGVEVIKAPIRKEIFGKKFFLGHGDGLGPGDHGYKFIKKVFANPLCQWLFARIHPNFGIGLARFWSGKSRAKNPKIEEFHGADREWLISFAEEHSSNNNVDYYIFGHRHLPIDHQLTNGSTRYINLGEWMNFNSYAVFDGENIKLEFFEKPAYDYPCNW